MARLFTPKIASYYEDYYKSKGVNFIKGTVLSSFDFDSNGKVLFLQSFSVIWEVNNETLLNFLPISSLAKFVRTPKLIMLLLTRRNWLLIC